MIQVHDPRIFISSPLNTTPNGSSMFLHLTDPIKIPVGAVNATLAVVNATFWFNFPNVLQKKWYFRFDGQAYSGSIPDGLYSLGELQASLSRFLTNAGLDPIRVAIGGDEATQKILFEFNSGDPEDAFLFTSNDSLWDLLGMPLGTEVSPTIVPEIISADKVAAFNNVNSVLFSTNFIRGIPKNGIYSGILVQVPLNVSPGSQQTYEPSSAVSIPANEMIGRSIDDLQFHMTNENGEALNTLGESFSLTVNLSYFINPQNT